MLEARGFVLVKLTTDKYEASRGLFATAELLVSMLPYEFIATFTVFCCNSAIVLVTSAVQS